MDAQSRPGRLCYTISSLLLVIACPAAAQAHIGAGPAAGLWHGFSHPVTGLDHLAAMIAVGLWAAQRGGRAVWMVPLAFVTVMAVGGVLGMAAIAVPLVEPAIVASVLVLGVLIAAAVRLPLLASTLIVGQFALFHGHAHGAEMPATALGLAYGSGFITATALLHTLGIGLGLAAQRFGTAQLARYAGGVIAACGVYLCIA